MAEHDQSNRIVFEAVPEGKDISVSVRVLIAFFIAFCAALLIAYSAYSKNDFSRKSGAQPDRASPAVEGDN